MDAVDLAPIGPGQLLPGVLAVQTGVHAVLLRVGHPHGHGAAPVEEFPVPVIELGAHGGRPGACGRRQHVPVVAGELVRHHVAHAHALHVHPALVDVVLLQKMPDERLHIVEVVVVVPVLRVHGQGQHQLRVGLDPGGHALDGPHLQLVALGEHHDEPLSLRHHGPGGVDGLGPAVHHAAVVADHERHGLRAVVALRDVLIPAVLQTVRKSAGHLLKLLRVDLGVVAVLVHRHVGAHHPRGHVVPVEVVGGTGDQFKSHGISSL